MKLFQVRIDNDPGGWKSGQDNHVLVIAETSDAAVEMVKNGWSKTYGYQDEVNCENFTYTYGNFPGQNEYISDDAELSATEIKFQGVKLTTIREAKLERILKEK